MAKSKKEIDKDIMYSKIMPSGLKRSERPTEPIVEIQQGAQILPPVVVAAVPPRHAVLATTPTQNDVASSPADTAPPSLDSKEDAIPTGVMSNMAPVSMPATALEGSSAFFSRSGVPLHEKQPKIVINLMERLVADRLDAAFDKFNCCKCDKCRKDVAAIALNKLAPKYMVTEEDQISALVLAQGGTEVPTALVQAILIVRAHPRH